MTGLMAQGWLASRCGDDRSYGVGMTGFLAWILAVVNPRGGGGGMTDPVWTLRRGDPRAILEAESGKVLGGAARTAIDTWHPWQERHPR